MYSGNRIIAHGPDMTSQCTHFQACVCTGLAAADACTRSEEYKNPRVKDIGHIEISMLKSEIIQCFFSTKSLYLYIHIQIINHMQATHCGSQHILYFYIYIHTCITYLCIYMYICIYTCFDIHVYTYIYLYLHLATFIFIYIHVYAVFQSGLGGPGLCAILVDLENCSDASYIYICIYLNLQILYHFFTYIYIYIYFGFYVLGGEDDDLPLWDGSSCRSPKGSGGSTDGVKNMGLIMAERVGSRVRMWYSSAVG